MTEPVGWSRMSRWCLVCSVSCGVLLWMGSTTVSAQSNPYFNVRLNINYESAERSVGLLEGLTGSGRDIVSLRGSMIALATTADLARRRLSPSDLESALDGIKFGQVEAEDYFRLKEARENVAEIKELLTIIKRRNFAQRVASTVEQLFPSAARITTTVPMYVVAFGHNNIDAYVRRVVWDEDVPRFVGEGEGELTIVLNLSKGIHYGRTPEEQFIGVLSVVAHEVFHAAFGVYKDSSPLWQEYYAASTSYLDRLLDLTHNEGIAHFLTYQQRTGGAVPRDWNVRISTAMSDFNRSSEELLSGRISPSRASYLIATSNTSEYWRSYGAITGMFIARTIDERLGRVALVETIERGPNDFFEKYHVLTKRDNSLPRLSEKIIRHMDSYGR